MGLYFLNFVSSVLHRLFLLCISVHNLAIKINWGRIVIKKIIMLIAVGLIAFSAAASDWTPLITNLDTHPEVLWGICPMYIEGGVSYDGFEFIEDRETRIQLIVGGGYGQRKLWQNPTTGESTASEWVQPLTYDVGYVNWAVRFIQGFWDSPWDPGSDLLQIMFAYEGRYEYNTDSLAVGQLKSNYGNPSMVESLDQFFHAGDSSVYPDLQGNRQFLATNLHLGLTLDLMTDTIIKNDGIRINLDFNWSPYALNSALDGKADFYSITFNALGAKTLYSITDENWDWFSIQVLDRIFINWTSGSMIPVYAQNNGSLGRQVRGFADFSMNREFAVVNNFEFRFTGPMLGTKLLYPRLSLFVDVGYGMGRYYNTDWNPSGDFVASTGASISITLIDAIDLGVSAIYLIEGENYAKGPGSFVTEFFFFLDL